MPASIVRHTVTQIADPIQPHTGQQVTFTLPGVAAGSVVLLLPIGFDPRVRILYALAVVDTSAAVMFEFVNVGSVAAIMPSNFQFIVVIGV